MSVQMSVHMPATHVSYAVHIIACPTQLCLTHRIVALHLHRLVATISTRTRTRTLVRARIHMRTCVRTRKCMHGVHVQTELAITETSH